MRKAAVLFIFALGALLFVLATMVQSLLVIQQIAAVSEVTGMVKVRPRGEKAFVPLAGATHVTAGSILQTGSNGGVTLNWGDGSRIRVGPSTTMQVLKCQIDKTKKAETYLFRLDIGRIWVRVLRALSEESKFEIRTPTATAAVRGTVFSVAVDPDGSTRVSVYEGRVVLDSNGRDVIVGERQTAAAGHAPESARELSDDDEAEWDEMKGVALPFLALTEPGFDKIPAGVDRITVKGVAERHAEVTINGEPIKTNLVGEFETELLVPADADQLAITVRAEDAKGFESVVVKQLAR